MIQEGVNIVSVVSQVQGEIDPVKVRRFRYAEAGRPLKTEHSTTHEIMSVLVAVVSLSRMEIRFAWRQICN